MDTTRWPLRGMIVLSALLLAVGWFIGTRVSASAPAGAPQVATDGTAPAAPVGLAASSAHTSVLLTWTDPPDTDLSSLRILRRTGEATILRATVAPGVQTYTDQGADVVVGTTYTYDVQATDTAGNIGTAATVSVTVTAAPAVPLPTTPGTPTTTLPPTPPVTGGPRVVARFSLEQLFGVDRVSGLTSAEIDTLITYLVHGTTTASQALAEDARREILTAFRDVYTSIPKTSIDYRILEAMILKADGSFTEDITTLRRNIVLERRQIGTFGSVNGHLPGQGATTPAEVDADWKALRILTYGHIPITIDSDLERTVLRAFLARDLMIAAPEGTTARKRPGVGPTDPIHRRIIRACAYGNPGGCGLVK
jgi:hypothetical protein